MAATAQGIMGDIEFEDETVALREAARRYEEEAEQRAAMLFGEVNAAGNGLSHNSPGGSEAGPHDLITATPNRGAMRHYGNVRSIANSGSAANMLGSHGRQPLTPRTKRYYKDFAESCCEEENIPESKRAHIIEAAQLSMHELLIKVLVSSNAPMSEEDGLSALQTFIASDSYKEFIRAPIDLIFLDPKLSSFKLGFTARLLHHIRLNPGQYHIPHRLIPFLTTKVFAAAVSRSVVTSRSELKRKLKELLGKEANIYAIVTKLVGNLKSRVTVSEDLWYRWAWMHIAYSRFEKLDLDRKTFWNWVDNELSVRRQSVKNMAEPARSEALKRMLKQSFDKHLQTYPPTKKLTASKQRETLWQTNAAQSITAMEEYSLDEIPDDVDEEHDD